MHGLRDQRTMYGKLPADVDGKATGAPAQLQSADDVQAYWHAWAEVRAMKGQPRFPLAPERDRPTHSRRPIPAYVDEGRWVAQCTGGPHGDCNGGIACWPDHGHGCCLDCGTVYPIQFPPAHEIADAEAVLMARPPQNRHWRPARGETVANLKAENLTHGHGLTPDQERARIARQVVGKDELSPSARKIAERLLSLPESDLEQLRRILGEG